MEKLEMKIDVKDFDSETMDEIVSYMYGKPIGNAPTNFLFEAAERFQMDDLKKDVAKLAKQKMILENVVETAELAEKYDYEGLFKECAEFIVDNEVYLKKDFSSKLKKMVFTILNKNLKDVKMKVSELEKKLFNSVDPLLGNS